MSYTADNSETEQGDPKYKYWRASIALSFKYRPTFEARISQLGIKSLGELVMLISTADDAVVDALKPHAERYVNAHGGAKSTLSKKEQKLVEAARSMSPDKLAELLALAQQGQAT